MRGGLPSTIFVPLLPVSMDCSVSERLDVGDELSTRHEATGTLALGSERRAGAAARCWWESCRWNTVDPVIAAWIYSPRARTIIIASPLLFGSDSGQDGGEFAAT
ncbi:hypothetical protein CC78DRAFT_583527 [Lojkania enalia]|uniref:Uncharacterized protein n=1 Tax=Lojkania enalia TaxID=147567 RepID=A0A9P4N1I6_9PLEO|nr:hypothetical protein CC78DRAFT_583527 [Didymosphaeria enalia]